MSRSKHATRGLGNYKSAIFKHYELINKLVEKETGDDHRGMNCRSLMATAWPVLYHFNNNQLIKALGLNNS